MQTVKQAFYRHTSRIMAVDELRKYHKEPEASALGSAGWLDLDGAVLTAQVLCAKRQNFSIRSVSEIALLHVRMRLKSFHSKVDQAYFLRKRIQPLNRFVNSCALLGVDIETMVV